MAGDLLKNERGMAAILAVVIICAAALLIAKSLIGAGLTGLDMASDFTQGQKALVLADSCLEETLRRLQIDSGFSADKLAMPMADGACVVSTEADGNKRTIDVAANAASYYKRIRAEAEIRENGIDLIKWEETN